MKNNNLFDELGATLLESALVLSLIAVAALVSVQRFGMQAALASADSLCVLQHVNDNGHGFGFAVNTAGCPLRHCRTNGGFPYNQTPGLLEFRNTQRPPAC